VPAVLSIGALNGGGVLGYPLDQIYEEVAFVAYHFHWSHDQIMEMEHAYRRQWVQKISSINSIMNQG
jgi:Family of unknown function (DUF6760)